MIAAKKMGCIRLSIYLATLLFLSALFTPFDTICIDYETKQVVLQ
jgi:hypothetical protein